MDREAEEEIATEKMAKIKLDLHEMFNRGEEIEAALNRVITEAVRKRIPLVEIVPGKGTGQLKKHVLRFIVSCPLNIFNLREIFLPDSRREESSVPLGT